MQITTILLWRIYMSARGIKNQRVIITAGGSGIGRAIADLLIENGAKVHICDIVDDFLDKFAKDHPKAGVTKSDVSNESDVARLFSDASITLGGLDAMINNAGIAGPTKPVEDISLDEWKSCLDIGLTGQFLCTRLAVPLLKANGGGTIVNMSSVAGKHGFPGRSPYSAVKYGVIGITETWARELGPANIRVNAIQPGVVEGARIDAVIAARAKLYGKSVSEVEKGLLEHVSLRRMVTGQDIAETTMFLMSDAAKNISGQTIAVDGNVETL
jgi:NAD(P)-dependent dehydrogenase (short-subunit alcohol dehydrogenase family)